MTEHLSHEGFVLAQRVEAARIAQEALAGRLSILEAARLIVGTGVVADDPEFRDVLLVADETAGLPVGAERQNWLPEALERKTAEIAKAEAWARGVAIDAVRKIADRYGAV